MLSRLTPAAAARLALIAAAAALPAGAGVLPPTPFTEDARGLTGASFLKLPVGARPNSLGGTYAAASGDPDSLFWNPAGLARVRGRELAASYDALLETAYASALAFAAPFRDGVAAASLLLYSQSAVDSFDALGSPTGDFTPYDLAVTAGWARARGPVALGAALRLLRQELAGRSASGWALDLGLQMRDGGGARDSPVDAGIALRNLGAPVALGTRADPLPLDLSAGLHWRSRPRLSTFLDLHLPVDDGPFLSVGQEVRVPAGSGAFALRGGYTMRRRGELSGLAGFAAGLGLDLGALRAEYAWVPLGELGATHRVTLGFRL